MGSMVSETSSVFRPSDLKELRELLLKALKAPSGHRRQNARHLRTKPTKSDLPEVELSLAVRHQEAVAQGDFGWIPPEPKGLLHYLQRRKVDIAASTDNLVYLGRLKWTKFKGDDSEAHTIITGSTLHKVFFTHIDPAVRTTFSSKRLAWIASLRDGHRLMGWYPVSMQFVSSGSSCLVNHLHLRPVIEDDWPEVNYLYTQGKAHIAVLNITHEHVKVAQKVRKKKLTRTAFVKPRRPSGTLYEGSALIAANVSQPSENEGRISSSRNFQSLVQGMQSMASAQEGDNRGAYLGTEICARCDGGNLPTCPQCDGKGWLAVYENDIQSNIRMSRSPALSLGTKLASPFPSSNPKIYPDHESVGRADPNDASRSVSIVRENGKFGSMPLYDDYDG
ncbi:hypothetical protein PuT2_15375 [Pusillimonas sp. T2]|uniref:hypothetical protein n=1 Tax=Pusillimonas sp. T2 TaxID=1548123 RepID=UPI000B8B10A3|nr:hypothetical protein [Pusillimonas sp. T2]OXR47903.1 hypothetical protein PuT2_15375 [Pusillimonas sp. T2]